MTFFLVIDHKFRFPPLFSLFQYISPLFRKNYSFPLLLQISPPVLGKFICFLHTLHVFFPPTLTMMHLCITQCTYWTPLEIYNFAGLYRMIYCYARDPYPSASWPSGISGRPVRERIPPLRALLRSL